MRIRTPADLGALIRSTRKNFRLEQSTLARKIGVSRLWLVDIEKGSLVRRSAESRRLAAEVHQNPEELLGKLRVTAEAMPDHVLQAQELASGDGLVHPVVDRLSEKLVARARECGRLLK
jgi:DNA-binding XRE family transcriptional regulator